MLQRLKVERFKSIRAADIGLGKVNLFVGANGTGKSNILEVVGIISAMLGRGLDNADLSKKGIRLTPPELMKSAHKNRDLPKTLELEAVFSSNITYKCNLASGIADKNLKVHSESAFHMKKKLFGRSGRGNQVLGSSIHGVLDKNRGMWDQVKAVYAFKEDIISTINEISKYRIYSPQTDFLRGRQFATPEDSPIGLHGEGLPEAVSDLLKQIRNGISSNADLKSIAQSTKNALDMVFLPGWTRGVRVGKLDKHMVSSDIKSDPEKMIYFLDRFMNESRNKLSAYDSSEGTLFLLFSAVLLSHKDAPKYFSIDNIDNALNPAMTRALVEKIIEITLKSTTSDIPVGPKQVFLTSHSPTSLDAIDLFDDAQRAFVVSREKTTGETIIRRLQPKIGMSRTDWALVNNGKKLSQMWLDGNIDGLSGSDDF